MKKLKIETRGRAPIGQRAMTSAERQRRYRTRVKASGKAATGGKPPKQPKSNFDWATVKPISGAAWQTCYRKTPHLQAPPIEDCDAYALAVSDAVQAWSRREPGSILGNAGKPMQQLLRRLPAMLARFRAGEAPGPLPEDHPHFRRLVACELIARASSFLLKLYPDDAPDWCDLANNICAYAMVVGRASISHAKDPLCIIVHLVLQEMGVHKSPHAISMALRGRRGRMARARPVDKKLTL
jgi:hypothetical protein